MSSTPAATVHSGQTEHHEPGFIRTYVFSTDHKMIARQFLFLALFMMSIGGLMAMLMRWELAWPESPVPFFHWVPEPYMCDGAIPPNTYNSMFTMHATIMIFSWSCRSWSAVTAIS
jgi:cytochrome c oxidase subunit 1